MFKRGDKVKCISIGNHIITSIEIGKVYTISQYPYVGTVLYLQEFKECYTKDCFIVDITYIRKQKLEKLCLSQEKN